jgi:hypothetical protein
LRETAARAIGEASAASERATLSMLLNDSDVDVRRAAIWAAGCVKDAALWPAVIAACDAPATAIVAMQALAGGDEQALDPIQNALQAGNTSRAGRVALAESCSRMRCDAAIPALKWMTKQDDAGVRAVALSALASRRIPLDAAAARAGARDEAARMAWLCAAMMDACGQDARAVKPLLAALQAECDRAKDRLLLWLALGWNIEGVLKARDAFQRAHAGQQAYAIELIDTQLPAEMKGWVMPALEPLAPAVRLSRWQTAFPQTQQPLPARLRQAGVGAPAAWLAPWTKACALHAVAALPARECADVVARSGGSPDWVVRDVAAWAGARLSANGKQGEATMLSTVERVMILKGASMFAGTPDDALAEVAALLHEVDAGAGETLFVKGELGDCLYVIVSGRVRIHDGARTLNDLAEGDAFGEMALLDPEPRLASARVVEQARLLRLNREPFFDLMEAHPEVSIGIIHMLTRRLRERVQDISRLDAQVRALAGASGGI